MRKVLRGKEVSVIYCYVTEYLSLSGLKQLFICLPFYGLAIWVGVSWVVLLLVSPGVTQVAVVIDSLTGAGWSKRSSLTWLAADAGCQLVPLSVHLVASRPPEGQAEFLCTVAEHFRRMRAEAAGLLEAEAWRSRGVSSAVFFCWSGSRTGPDLEREDGLLMEAEAGSHCKGTCTQRWEYFKGPA